MGLFAQLVGGVTRRLHRNQVYEWMRQASVALDAQVSGLTQTAWFVDPVNGNDANNGTTLATSLKTDAERQRRWGPSTILTAPTTLTYASSPPATDPVNFDVQINRGGSLTIQGTRTVVLPAVALSAVTTINRATQTPWDVTAVGLGAAHVGKIIRITNGTRAGNNAIVVKDLGGGKVRVSPFGTLSISLSFIPWVAVTPVAPTDLVEVVDVPVLSIGTMRFRSGSNADFVASPAENLVIFDSIKIDGGLNTEVGTIITDNVSVWMGQTILTNTMVTGAGAVLMGGGALGNFLAVATAGFFIGLGFAGLPGTTCAFAGVSVSSFGIVGYFGDSCVIGLDCIFQNCAVDISGQVQGDRVSCFDAATANTAFVIEPGATYISRVYNQTDLLWGTANAGFAVSVSSGGKLFYVTKPTINGGLGVGRESRIGGTDKQWGAVPYAETAAFNLATIATLT
jgi:hypothetical protein